MCLCGPGNSRELRRSNLEPTSLCAQSLKSLTAIENDLQPYAGVPGYTADGKRIPSQDTEAAEAATETEDPAKSQKPN
jgi:hypothetical protein